MFLAIRDLWWARGRFLLMTAAIALITLLVVMLSGLTEGLGRQSTSAITSLRADQIAMERPASGEALSMSTSRITPAALLQARTQPGVRAADPIGITATRVSIDHMPVPATLFGVDPGAAVAPRGVSATSTVVSSDLASDHAVHVGDIVDVAGTKLRVARIVDDASFSHVPVVWVPRSLWRHTSGAAAGECSVLALRTTKGYDAAAFDSATGLVAKSKGDSLSAIGSYSAENGSLTLIRVLLIAISALVIGAFFTVWTVQREGDLAVLKAIGARTGYLLRDALGQALLTLLIGGGIGTAAALGLGLAARGNVPVVIDFATVAVPFGLMVAVGLVGAVAALRRVVTVDPMTALAGAR
ncbi:FtsX-like permease family protein [Flexivirga oryzae]|uniref:Putative ABC transport system permease protein n=1 Tax=Flexivirga oryzae TaxID=1794944 RepID=A0A839N7Y4_9MICO|nr:putative ABC transport system permease protein [Flexivirga oryzae]